MMLILLLIAFVVMVYAAIKAGVHEMSWGQLLWLILSVWMADLCWEIIER